MSLQLTTIWDKYSDGLFLCFVVFLPLCQRLCDVGLMCMKELTFEKRLLPLHSMKVRTAFLVWGERVVKFAFWVFKYT